MLTSIASTFSAQLAPPRHSQVDIHVKCYQLYSISSSSPPATAIIPGLSSRILLVPKQVRLSSNLDSTPSLDDSPDVDYEIEIQIEKIGKNSRRILSKIAIDATLQTVWNILTDYERLSDFIPGLAVSKLLEKNGKTARLFQIGQQNLALGLKLNAKGIVDCYEKDVERLPFGERRDIEFKMIEGDFVLFEGKWSIEQLNIGRNEDGQELNTSLSYVVDVEPKRWLPVRLVEGRLCREIKMNLSCIREEAQRATQST